MDKQSDILNSFYEKQAMWMQNQLANYKENSFKNFEQARKDFECYSTSYLTPKKVEAFRDSYLSELGLHRLKTTLKVFKTRQKKKGKGESKLDVTISFEAYLALEKIIKETKLTKKAVIEQLLLNNNEMFE